MQTKNISSTLVLVTMVLLTFFSCKKESTPITPVLYQEENPLNSFLTTTGLNLIATPFSNTTAFEMGYAFKPKVKGIIKGLTVKLPYVNASLKVTIWDKATATVVRSTYVNVATANQDITVTIPNLELAQNTEYVISMYTNMFYNHKRTDNANVVFPVDAGNISITGSYTNATTNMPATTNASSFCGDFSFIFQQKQ